MLSATCLFACLLAVAHTTSPPRPHPPIDPLIIIDPPIVDPPIIIDPPIVDPSIIIEPPIIIDPPIIPPIPTGPPRPTYATPDPHPTFATHDASVLDLAFALDVTGSMGSYIAQAQSSIYSIVEQIVRSEKSDVRLALVKYRDHEPEDRTFVTDVLDFTPSVTTMKQKLDGCSANGGGDEPEAVADALGQVKSLSWRQNATKITILISDAPPHGLKPHGDSFRNGCPDSVDPMNVTKELAKMGVTLYSVGCEPSVTPYRDFFMAVAYMTGGQYIPLVNSRLLASVIVGGVQEEINLEKLMTDVTRQVQEEAEANGGSVNQTVIIERVYNHMREQGVKSKKLQRNNADLSEASARAKGWSAMASMDDVRRDYADSSPEAPSMGGGVMGYPVSADVSRRFRPSGTLHSESAAAYAPAPGVGLDGGPGYHSGSDAGRPGPSGGSTETYGVTEDDISLAQVERMVNRALAREGYATES